MHRHCLLLFSFLFSLTALCAETGLIASIEKQVVRQNRDGKATTWFHPRACRVPSKRPAASYAFMTVQSIGGSDYFGPVHWSESSDLGKTWAKFRPIPSLGRVPVAKHPGLMAGVCDVVPQYHPPTKTILAMGHVVFYKGPKFARGDQLARYPVYTVRRSDGTWSKRRILEWNDPRGAFIYSNNCGQRVVLPNGDILLAFTFGDKPTHRSVAGVLCGFDGEKLSIKKVGPPLKLAHKRGLLEPSITQFGGKFYITIRAEDDHGYQSVSSDGLNWEPKQRWVWDNDEPVTMSTTQQHWLTHSDGLFLVYTRKDKSNTGIIRWRAPLYVAQVDVLTRRLIRSTERVVLPLVGDGVNDPNNVALMGNFNVTNAGPDESWVSVGEWMPQKNARGDLLLARIRWSRPNRLAK
ncbi:MAG: exo-alpha-sialidase [Verrucomicrobiales bacterium]|nr:exo-alpha-sialidase [Verrucomicrobiales bacterium]